MLIRILLGAVLLLATAAAADEPVFRRAGHGAFVANADASDPTVLGMPLQSCIDGTVQTLCYGPVPVSAVVDANDEPISGDPICVTMKYYEFIDLNNPAAQVCGVQIGDYLPSATSAWWRSQMVVTTDGTNTMGGTYDITGTLKVAGETTTTGTTIGPFIISFTHSTTRRYGALGGGAAVTLANVAGATTRAGAACTKLKRFNVELLDSSEASRTMPSSNSTILGLRVNGTDLATTQTISASTTGSITAPATTTGWAIDIPIAVWVEGVGSDTTAEKYRIWVSCY